MGLFGRVSILSSRNEKVSLAYSVHGDGPVDILFIHGNLAHKGWIEPALTHLKEHFRVWAIDWRGAGESDSPPAGENYEHYRMPVLAHDFCLALEALGVSRCHLATHSTGGLIGTYMLLCNPARFGRVVGLDSVTPKGIDPATQLNWRETFAKIAMNREFARSVMATTAPTLFNPPYMVENLLAGDVPTFADAIPVFLREIFENTVVDGAHRAGDTMRYGTITNLIFHYEEHYIRARDKLEASIAEIRHPHLLLHGGLDEIIAKEDLEWMAGLLPNCRFEAAPGVGHSMNIENPKLYARYITSFLSEQP